MTVLDRIEEWRNAQLVNSQALNDGSLGDGGPYDTGSISDACKVSKKKGAAEHLYMMTFLSRPSCSLELGTNIGISSSYIAAAMAARSPNFELHTIEASPYRLRLAKELHTSLGLKVNYHGGMFYDVLPKVLDQLGQKVGLAFIDGQHQFQPTLDFFDLIYPYSTPSALFVFDDIEWSDGMKNAWQAIKADKRFSFTTELTGVGYGIRAD